MINRFRDVACVLMTVLLLGMAGAAAQTGQPPTSPIPVTQGPDHAPQSGSASTAQAPAQPAGPQINVADITARANRDVGADIQTTISGWQRELDRLESDLQKPRLRYSELNSLRDELQRVRAGVQELWNRLETSLATA